MENELIEQYKLALNYFTDAIEGYFTVENQYKSGVPMNELIRGAKVRGVYVAKDATYEEIADGVLSDMKGSIFEMIQKIKGG